MHAPTSIYLEDQSIMIEGYKVHGSQLVPFSAVGLLTDTEDQRYKSTGMLFQMT